MAKDTSDRSTSAEPPTEKPPQRELRFNLPPEQEEAVKLPPEPAEAWRKFVEAEREHPEHAAREQTKADEDRKVIDRAMAVRDNMAPPPWLKQTQREVLQRAQPIEAPKPVTPLPTTRPMGVGPKVWIAAQAIVALGQAGEVLVDRETMRKMVRAHTGQDVSMRTLAEALMFLRRGGHFAR